MARRTTNAEKEWSDEERAEMALRLICEMADVDTFDEQCECAILLGRIVRKQAK